MKPGMSARSEDACGRLRAALLAGSSTGAIRAEIAYIEAADARSREPTIPATKVRARMADIR
jgi:hypothetical protein